MTMPKMHAVADESVAFWKDVAAISGYDCLEKSSLLNFRTCSLMVIFEPFLR